MVHFHVKTANMLVLQIIVDQMYFNFDKYHLFWADIIDDYDYNYTMTIYLVQDRTIMEFNLRSVVNSAATRKVHLLNSNLHTSRIFAKQVAHCYKMCLFTILIIICVTIKRALYLLAACVKRS